MTDPLLLNDWHAVAKASDLAAGSKVGVQLLSQDVVIWRGKDSALHAWKDQCPHRGSKLSLGEVRDGEALVCPYHGWRFDGAGQCVLMPAHPDKPPSSRARATVYGVTEKYGLVWVSLGGTSRSVPPFHGIDENYRLVIAGPYDVETSGPRAIENFLDLAHFPFVHAGWLGEEPFTSIDGYSVDVVDDEILVTNASAYQPRANVASAEGVKVGYSYRVLRPLAAMLTKEPGDRAQKPSDVILLAVQPKTETSIRAWFVLAMNYGFDQPESYFRTFQDSIFLQDKPVLESQRPKLLPLDPTAELHQPADKTSNTYRRWLREKGLRYGVILPAIP